MKFNLAKKIGIYSTLALAASISISTCSYAVAVAPLTSDNLPVINKIDGATATYNDGTSYDTLNIDQTNSYNSAQNSTRLDVDVQSKVGVIDYNSFNIGQGNTVNFGFNQANQVVINKVDVGAPASTIFGNITQSGNDGKVFLINPNGILFGSSANVNLSAFGASTLGYVNHTVSDEGYLSSLTLGNNLGNSIELQNGAQINAGNLAFVSSVMNINGKNTNINANNLLLLAADGVKFEADNTGNIDISNIESVKGASSINFNDGNIIGGNVSVMSYIDNAYSNTANNIINLNGVITANNTIVDPDGNLYIYAENKNSLGNATVNVGGNLYSNGNIVVNSTNNNLNFNANATSDAGKISIKTGKDLNITGIEVANNISSSNGVIIAGNNSYINSNISSNDNIEISNKSGSLSLYGDISSNSSVYVTSLGSANLYSNIYSSKILKTWARNNLSIYGALTTFRGEGSNASSNNMYIESDLGDIFVDKSSVLQSDNILAVQAAKGNVSIYADTYSGGATKIINGSYHVVNDAPGKTVTIVNNSMQSAGDMFIRSCNNLYLKSNINAGSNVNIGSNTGLVTLKGNINQGEYNGTGFVTVWGKNLLVSSNITSNNGLGLWSQEDIVLNGKLVALEGQNPELPVNMYVQSTNGNILVGRSSLLQSAGNLYVQAAKGNVAIYANIFTGGETKIRNGSYHVVNDAPGKTVTIINNSIQSAGEIFIRSCDNLVVSSNISTGSNVNMGTNTGWLILDGKINRGDFDLTGFVTLWGNNLIVNSDITSDNGLGLWSQNSIYVTKTLKTVDNALNSIANNIILDSKGDLNILGNVNSANDIYIDTHGSELNVFGKLKSGSGTIVIK